MNKLLLILLCLPMVGFGQQTYVPDDNFEQELINLGYDNVLDDYVATANIDTVSELYLGVFSSLNQLSDLTGLEDFISLEIFWMDLPNITTLDVNNNTSLTELIIFSNQLYFLDISDANSLALLDCSDNQISSLDLSQNTALIQFDCSGNQITSLDLSQNTDLIELDCSGNQITSLDLSQNTDLTKLNCSLNALSSLDVSSNTVLTELICVENNITSLNISQNTSLTNLHCNWNSLILIDVSGANALTSLYCSYNALTSLDVSQNASLTILSCSYNHLTHLDVRNGNNTNFTWFRAENNYYMDPSISSLNCISVDNAAWSISNWYDIDQQTTFSNNCNSTTSILDIDSTNNLFKTIDILGRETKQTNQPLFYIYDDGTVEKRIVIE